MYILVSFLVGVLAGVLFPMPDSLVIALLSGMVIGFIQNQIDD